MSYKVLKKVKETFNIFNDGRKHNPAPQKWVLSALQNVISSSITKERIALNEAEGFYGHTIRELSGKINPAEMELIEKDGKFVQVNVLPAIRTVSLEIDELGNVTHEQEFLDTDPGHCALAAYEAGSGGFSWAFSGGDGVGGRVARDFSAFDYVRQPNFIPKHRQQALFSSMSGEQKTEQLLLSSMLKSGVEHEVASSMLAQYNQSHGDEHVIDQLLLSQLIEREDQREKLLSSVIKQSPFFISESQKNALLRCGDDDVDELNLLFSAMHNTDLSHLPLNENKAESMHVPADSLSYPSFERSDMRFGN